MIRAIDRADITGVILCGGGARRMEGVEKALQPLGGLPLVAHVQARLSPQVGRVIVSANRASGMYAQWATTVLADDVLDGGPLAGIATALRCAISPFLFCCPGDAPFLHETLVDRLATAVTLHDADIAIPHDGERDQHLFALIRSAEYTSLVAYLDSGERAVHGWLAGRRVVTVDASDIASHFVNINTVEQLAAASTAVRDAHSSMIADVLQRNSFKHPTVEHQ